MTDKNGKTQAPQLRPEENVEQMVQIAPIDVHLNSCSFEVGDLPQGGKVIVFQHQTGVIRFTASLPPDAVSTLIQKLTGGIVVARDVPVMQ
jgi:hypothetical protein